MCINQGALVGAHAIDRIRRKIIPPIDLTEYKVVEEIADATYLSMYEIEMIRNLDLSLSPKLEMARDLLVLGCLTGHDFLTSAILNQEISGMGNCISNNKSRITGW